MTPFIYKISKFQGRFPTKISSMGPRCAPTLIWPILQPSNSQSAKASNSMQISCILLYETPWTPNVKMFGDYSGFSFEILSEYEVCKTVKDIKMSKSSAYSEISTRLF